MWKRFATRLVLNFRVVMLVVTSLLLFLGAVSVYNQLNWAEPLCGLRAVEGESFVHVTADGSGVAESQSALRRLGLDELLEGNRQVLVDLEGECLLPDGRVLAISWSLDDLSSGRRLLHYRLRRGEEVVDSWSESFESYDDLFPKLAFDLGAGATLNLRYLAQVASGSDFQTASLSVVARRVAPQAAYFIVAVVGFAFLAIGFVVYFSGASRRLANATMFFVICLAAFALLVLEFTISSAPLSWAIFWLDKAAFLFTPVILLHFFYLLSRDRFGSVWSIRTAAFYLPSVLLLAANLAVMNFHRLPPWDPSGSVVNLNWLFRALEKAEVVLFGLLVAAGLAVLLRAFRATDSVEKKKQLQWLFWGIGIGLMPTVLVSFPLVLLELPTGAANVAVSVPLLVAPVCFAFAVFRYRLMDVEVVFKRGFVYILSSLTVLAVYFLLMFWLNAFGSAVGTQALVFISGIIILMATLFSHRIKDQVQSFFDRALYRDFYNFRRALQRFSQELSYERDLTRLLEKIAERIRETFSVAVVMVFIATPDRRHYVLAHSSREGFPTRYLGDQSSSGLMERFASGRPLLLDELEGVPAAMAFREAGVQTLIPFVSLGEVIGFVALGNKTNGDILSYEDLELLSSLAGRAAVSVDNALLYRDLQRRAEELRTLKEFNESIVESVSSGICVIDTNGVVRSWNNALGGLLRVGSSLALGRPLIKLLAPPLVDALGPYLQEGAPTGGVHSFYKVKLPVEGGLEKVLNISIAPFAGEKGVAGSVMIVDDVTDWTAMEEQLGQRERLASLGLLSAGVAHEVNTPLTGISSYIQMLGGRLDGDEETRRLLAKVERQAFRASRIVSSLLSFSRQGASEPVEIDFNSLLSDSMALVEGQLRSVGVTVDTALADDLLRIYGDKGKLQQVLINLMLNARDAMPGGGKIRIATLNGEGEIHCRVSDEGVGIPEEARQRIYDPFFTTKRMGLGTGLGLSVSYGIIQEHMGSIEVESEVGVGTTFTVTLPVRPRQGEL